MTILTPRQVAENFVDGMSFTTEERISGRTGMLKSYLTATIETDRRALLAEDEEAVEVMARAMFGPANHVYDKRWSELPDRTITEDRFGDLRDPKEVYRGMVRAVLDSLRKLRGVK